MTKTEIGLLLFAIACLVIMSSGFSPRGGATVCVLRAERVELDYGCCATNYVLGFRDERGKEVELVEVMR